MKKQISALMLGSLLIGNSAYAAEFDSKAAAVGAVMMAPVVTAFVVGRNTGPLSTQNKLEVLAGACTFVAGLGFSGEYIHGAAIAGGLSTFLSGLAYFMLRLGK